MRVCVRKPTVCVGRTTRPEHRAWDELLRHIVQPSCRESTESEAVLSMRTTPTTTDTFHAWFHRSSVIAACTSKEMRIERSVR